MKENIKNLNEFKALKKCYETITLKEIERAYSESILNVPQYLTGYGNITTCTLCTSVATSGGDFCKNCVYVKLTKFSCNDGKNEKTYLKIYGANTPKELFDAYKARAKYMETLIK